MLRHMHAHKLLIAELFKTKLFEKGAFKNLMALGAQMRPGEAVASLLASCLGHCGMWKSQL